MINIYKILTLLFLSSFLLSMNDYYKDSDEDGYTDRQEIKFGSDPNDDSSVIYKGGWPYNMYKDNQYDPGFKGCTNFLMEMVVIVKMTMSVCKVQFVVINLIQDNAFQWQELKFQDL